MSTSELFALRNKLLRNGFEQFRRIVMQEKIKLDINDISNLFLAVYNHDNLRKVMIQYITFFANYDKSVLNIEIANRRRLLQDLAYNAKVNDIRQLINLFVTLKVPLKLYSVKKLINFALDGKGQIENIVGVINELSNLRNVFPEAQEQYQGNQKRSYLCLQALQKDMFLPAYEILKNNLGRLDHEYRQLFQLPVKVNKKEGKMLQQFVQLYLERTKCNDPYIKDLKGKTFIDRLSKEYQSNIQEIVKSYQKKMEAKQNVRRSQHKVKSSMGPGQNIKQYNTEGLNEASRQKMVINITNSEDELSIQKEANKIYQNYVNEKQKYYKYEKKQKKEIQQKQKRTGIMRSDQLRYYLEEEIKLQVESIKEENRQYKGHFNELINKLKQKLSRPLEINLEVFGSFRTELCLQQSDIDIAITSQNLEEQANPLKLLEAIEYILQQQQMKEYIQSVKFIKTATVPIIKVTCSQKYWRKKIDFTYQDNTHNGLQSVNLIKNYLKQYPQLQPLIFILKKFIYISNLSAPYLGGISSYGLILMIVAYIQQECKLGKESSEKLLVADLLIGFLKFYGFKMNYVMKCIQVVDKDKMNQKNYTGCVTRYNQANGLIDLIPKLVIIDPLNENNNVGRATHKIKQIQMAFQIAYISIHTFRQCGKKRKCESYRRISKLKIDDMKYSENVRPCCILKRMFSCTQKFIKE